MTNFIWITTQFEGFHQYLNAPTEVSFLQNKHRHIFHVKVFIEVMHNDRDIEFIMFKNYINFIINTKINKDNVGSCEMLADKIHDSVSEYYLNRKIKINVSEDLENGCEKEY